MIPAIFHSLRRESIKNASSASTIGVKSLRPTWFEEIAPTNEPTSETEQDPVLVDGNREYSRCPLVLIGIGYASVWGGVLLQLFGRSFWRNSLQPPRVLHCGKIKPKLVQKSFLRKSQDLHLDAVPTTYAQRSLRKRGSHTQALRFGTAQPFWTLSQRCCSKKHEPKQNKQDKLD